MRTRYRISVGGVQMDSLDNSIAILDIAYTQPERNIRKQAVANLNGVSIADTYVGQQTVTVTFEIHEYSISRRNEICQKVNEWAAVGGTLTTNDRSGQRLIRVNCEQYAEIASARNWTDPLTLVFATTSLPYWQSTSAKTRSITGKSTSGTLALDGNISNALVSVTVTAAESITSLQLKSGDTILKLTGLSIASGNQVAVSYTNDRYLSIKTGKTSLMGKLDPSSSDQLLAESGKSTTVSVTSNGKVTAVFSARGCFL